MTQFKDRVSEGLCFQILNMQFCLFPCHEKPRLMKWSNLWKLFLQRTLRQGSAVLLSFNLAFPAPTERQVEQLVQQSRLVHASIPSSVNGDNGITYLIEL